MSITSTSCIKKSESPGRTAKESPASTEDVKELIQLSGPVTAIETTWSETYSRISYRTATHLAVENQNEFTVRNVSFTLKRDNSNIVYSDTPCERYKETLTHIPLPQTESSGPNIEPVESSSREEADRKIANNLVPEVIRNMFTDTQHATTIWNKLKEKSECSPPVGGGSRILTICSGKTHIAIDPFCSMDSDLADEIRVAVNELAPKIK